MKISISVLIKLINLFFNCNIRKKIKAFYYLFIPRIFLFFAFNSEFNFIFVLDILTHSNIGSRSS